MEKFPQELGLKIPKQVDIKGSPLPSPRLAPSPGSVATTASMGKITSSSRKSKKVGQSESPNIKSITPKNPRFVSPRASPSPVQSQIVIPPSPAPSPVSPSPRLDLPSKTPSPTRSPRYPSPGFKPSPPSPVTPPSPSPISPLIPKSPSPIASRIPSPSPSPSPSPYPSPFTGSPVPAGLMGWGIGLGQGSSKGAKISGRLYRYTPTLVGVDFGEVLETKRIKKLEKQVFTGVEVRAPVRVRKKKVVGSKAIIGKLLTK